MLVPRLDQCPAEVQVAEQEATYYVERTAKIILGIWLAITAILALVIGLTLVRARVSNDSLARTVVPSVLFGPGQSRVRLDYAPEAMACPTVPLSIFLLIDKSGSMADGNALDLAKEAAIAFVNGVDLTQSSVAVAFFESSPDFVQPATQDVTTLTNAINQVSFAEGGTDITSALQLAAANLGNGQPVVILLTDGGAADPAGALSIGATLKAAGSHLVTIAVGPEVDSTFLRDLASSPTTALSADNPADLQAIYTGLAEQLSSVVATNLTLIEPVAEAFTVVTDSVNPPAVQDTNRLVWQSGFIPISGATYTYDVNTPRFGWFAVTTEAATMSFIDCHSGLGALSLGAGPHVLILPGLGFWVPWLLGLLLPVFLLFRSRRPFSPPEPGPTGGDPPPSPLPDPNPAWIRRLNAEKMLGLAGIDDESGNLVPTIIVGLGPVGRIVLSQVAQALDGRFTQRQKLPVRLLQVDVQPMGSPKLEPPDYLLSDEWVLLHPDYPQISRTLQNDPEPWAHMDWYEPTAMAEYGRARGRMALFYDLRNGAQDSTLFRGLSRAAKGMEKQPFLRIIGSTFDDVSSGMLIDISWLMWLVTQRNVDVELWLTGPMNCDWSPRLDNPSRLVSQSEQRIRTLATLREIERFQRNAIVPLHYVPHMMSQDEFHQDVDSAVVQTLFLFESPDNSFNNRSFSVGDHLATLTDSLVSLLNPAVQQEVTDHLARFKADAGVLVNQKGHGLVCGLGAYAIATPQAPLREALTWRLVHDLLCEARTGLLPGRRLTSNGAYEEQNPDVTLGSAVARRDNAQMFINGYHGRFNQASFLQSVAARVSDTVNGEGGGQEPALHRSGGIRRALKWVETVRLLLIQEGETDVAASLSSLIRQLKEWDEFLEQNLCPATQERLHRARENLEALTKQRGRSWSIDSDLEWPAYKANIRSWLDQPSSSGAGEPIIRAAHRFGWQVAYDPVARDWQVELWIPGGEFIWSGQPLSHGQIAVSRDTKAVLDRLYNLALPLAHNATQNINALSRAKGMNKNDWLQNARPRLDINELEVTRLLAGANSVRSLLAARETDDAAKVRNDLSGTGDADKIVSCAIEDRTTVTLLRVRDRVPLSAVRLYGSDVWDENSVTSGHYVWRGEQLAAARETTERFGTRFTGYLERDEKLVDLYARAVLFGLLRETANGLSIGGLEGDLNDWTWPGSSAGEGLKNIFSANSKLMPPALALPEKQRKEAFKVVERAIEDSLTYIDGVSGRAAFRREAERVLRNLPRSRHELESVEDWQLDYEEIFRPLAEADGPEDRDLRTYMLSILSSL